MTEINLDLLERRLEKLNPGPWIREVRTTMPALIAELREARTAIERVRAEIASVEAIVEHSADYRGVALPRTVRIDALLNALDGARD